jgi:hypothetical protein
MSNTERAAEFGVTSDQLRRECLMMEAAGLIRFRRVGTARLIEDGQVEQVKGWLRRRGLLAAAEAAPAV